MRLTILETGPREKSFVSDKWTSNVGMATLANCQVSTVFQIPKLCYPCHKFKLFYQEKFMVLLPWQQEK